MEAPGFHSGPGLEIPREMRQNEVFHRIHGSTTTTSTLYIPHLLFQPVFRSAQKEGSAPRGPDKNSFMDCLIFFNRLLILSLLSKPAVLCKILVWKAKGAFPGRTTSFLVRQRRSALHQRVVRSRKPTLHFLLLRARVQRLRQIEYHSQFGQVNSFTCRKQRPRAKKWRGAFSYSTISPLRTTNRRALGQATSCAVAVTSVCTGRMRSKR